MLLTVPWRWVKCLKLPPSHVERGLESGDVDLAVGYFPDLSGNNFFQQRLFTHRAFETYPWLRYTLALEHDAMMHEHERDASAWRIEWKAVPEACMMAGVRIAVGHAADPRHHHGG